MGAECVGKYRLEEELGVGAHGRVVKAYDTALGRIVALKSLTAGGDEKNNKALFKEAKTLARLSHLNIVTLYEVIEHDGVAFLAMEYIDGETLSARLKRGSLPIGDAITIIEKLADALNTASLAGIVHGDIKPGNIMIDSADAPRLVDFGLAKFSNREDALATLSATGGTSTSLEGTIPYMAPETVMGEKIDECADVFSLGAVFYEMLTGQRAFDGANQGATLSAVLNDAPVPVRRLRPDTPRWVGTLIEAMLQKEPALRLQSMMAVHARLLARGRRDWRALAQNYKARALRFIRKKRTAPQWFKAGGALTALGLMIWALNVIIVDVAPPVSVRIATGIDHIQHFEKKGAVKEAQAIFERIIADDPGHAAGEAGLALALIREYTSMQTDPAILARATTHAQAALNADPHLALANIAAAWGAEFNSNFTRAHELYDVAHMLDADNPLILEGRGRTLKKQGDFDAAMTVLEHAIEVHPEERVFYDDYGAILYREGRYVEAENAFRKSLEVQPENTNVYANLAHTLHMQGKTEDAIFSIQDGLKISQNATLYNNLGTYLFFEGRYSQAAKAFERTLEFEGNTHDYFYWANLADAYRWMSEREVDAKAAYRRAIQLIQNDIKKRPDHPGLHSRLALYASKAGDEFLAAASLEKAVKPPVAQPIIFYRAAVTREILGDRKGTIDMLARAIEAGYAFNEIANDPELTGLRKDPAYRQLLNKQGEMP